MCLPPSHQNLSLHPSLARLWAPLLSLLSFATVVVVSDFDSRFVDQLVFSLLFFYFFCGYSFFSAQNKERILVSSYGFFSIIS